MGPNTQDISCLMAFFPRNTEKVSLTCPLPEAHPGISERGGLYTIDVTFITNDVEGE